MFQLTIRRTSSAKLMFEKYILSLIAGDDIDCEVREKKRQLVEAYHRMKEKYPNVDAATMQKLVQEEHRCVYTFFYYEKLIEIYKY